MPAPSTATTKALVGKEVTLILNDGQGPLKPRNVKLLAADATGIAYSWSFRGTPRDDFAPWGAVHRISLKHGPSSEYPPKSWSKKFKKAKPSATGLKVVGKMCEVTVQDLQLNDSDRHSIIKGYVTVMDGNAIQFVYNSFGQVYTGVVSLDFLINVEYREKKDTKPPGVK